MLVYPNFITGYDEKVRPDHLHTIQKLHISIQLAVPIRMGVNIFYTQLALLIMSKLLWRISPKICKSSSWPWNYLLYSNKMGF
jgi:hypothetical protein